MLSLVGLIILIGILWGLILGYPIVRRKRKLIRLRHAIDDMDRLNGYQFEDYTAWLLKRNHFVNIHQTGKSHDYGLDVIAYRDHIKYGFQCKHYRKRQVDRKALRITADGAHYYRVQRAIVLTNRTFTPRAKDCHKFFHVALWDRSKLVHLIKQAISE